MRFANMLSLPAFCVKNIEIGDVGRIKNLSKSSWEYEKFYVFHWFLMQIRNILQWAAVSTACYGKSDNWTMETVYSELKVGNLL